MSNLLRKPETPVRDLRNPFETMRREFDDVMARFWPEGEFAMSRGTLPMMDVSETDAAVEVKLDLPGVKPEEIHVEVRGNEVDISGERKEEKEDKDEGRNFHRMERRWGRFARTATLPSDVAAEGAETTFSNGVLNLKLPKAKPSTTKTVVVKAL